MHANTWTTHRDAVLRLPSPADLAGALQPALRASRTVHQARHAIVDVLNGTDDRLVVIAGPCSVHDPAAARDYAARLALQRARFADELEIVMRVYFEKPRTTVGWKGLINDPLLDGSERIDAGLHTARALLCDINGAEMPAATEFLDPLSPRYLADLVAWGGPSARAPWNRRCIASWRRRCRFRSASRTAPTGTSRWPSMRCAQPRERIASCRSMRAGGYVRRRRPAIRIRMSCCAAGANRISTRRP